MRNGRRGLLARFSIAAVFALALVTPPIDSTAHAADPSSGASQACQADSRDPAKERYDKLDLEDHSGYRSDYIFGMSKGVMRSTMVPALKPVALVFTLPLDIVLLPFAAIGGLLR